MQVILRRAQHVISPEEISIGVVACPCTSESKLSAAVGLYACHALSLSSKGWQRSNLKKLRLCFCKLRSSSHLNVGCWLNHREVQWAGVRNPSLPLKDGKRLLRLAMLPELLALRTLPIQKHPDPERIHRYLLRIIPYNFDMEYWIQMTSKGFTGIELKPHDF